MATKRIRNPKSGPRGGRPTTYEPAYCAKVLEMAAEGAGRYEIAARLGCAYSTLQLWEKAHPEFAEAMRDARDASQGWWEAQGRKGIWSREFNAQAYVTQVRCRFPEQWQEKHSVSAGGITINITSDDAKL